MHTANLFRWGRLVLALALTATGTAHAQQYLAPASSSSDGPPAYYNGAGPGSQTNVQHTGTDVIRLAGTTQNLQVMVWDYTTTSGTSAVTLSWSQFNQGSSKPIAGSTGALSVDPSSVVNISDPDVVMAYYGGVLYANVVYLSDVGGANRTNRMIYQWTGAAFVPAGSPLQLGSNNQLPNVLGFDPPTVLRVHSAPNIDANAAGTVGIAWQESSVETAQITVVSASYPPPGYTYNSVSLTFAEGYFLASRIDGGLSCGTRGFLVSRDYSGSTTSPNQLPPILGNQTLLPDVAVAPDGKLWLAYINSSATQGTPPVTAGINLVIKQVSFDVCSLQGSTGLTKVFPINDVVNPPRIAATPNGNTPLEMEVVRAQVDGGGCFTSPARNIYNYGYAGSGYHNVTIVNSDVNSLDATEPVVAYYGGDPTTKGQFKYTGQYLVSWTGTDYPSVGKAKDVWARTLLAGAIAGTGDYSRVNTNYIGDQRYPSVAARYIQDSKSSAHLFANLYTADLGYKVTPTPAGYALARPAAPSVAPATSPDAETRVQAFPNPFSQAVEFNLHLAPQETVQRVQVTDLTGRVVETLTPPAEGSQTVTWHPKQAVATGSYMVRLVTNQRTETIRLSKQ